MCPHLAGFHFPYKYWALKSFMHVDIIIIIFFGFQVYAGMLYIFVLLEFTQYMECME